jgi:hypothetical protein
MRGRADPGTDREYPSAVLSDGDYRGVKHGMKTIEIQSEKRPLAEWLPDDENEDVIYLTRNGRRRYALVPLDEGDEEVLAMQNNADLMAYLDDCDKRARSRPRKTLAEIKERLGIGSDALPPVT